MRLCVIAWWKCEKGQKISEILNKNGPAFFKAIFRSVLGDSRRIKARKWCIMGNFKKANFFKKKMTEVNFSIFWKNLGRMSFSTFSRHFEEKKIFENFFGNFSKFFGNFCKILQNF